jgi:hypothetical protein
MTDQEYVQEVSRLADGLEANQISRHEWKLAMAELRDKRTESKAKATS